MPKPKNTVPKILKERTTAILGLASGKVLEFQPENIHQFIDSIERVLQHSEVLKIQKENEVFFVNSRMVETVSVKGAAVKNKTSWI